MEEENTKTFENTNHPCYGLDCKDCIQCKFDVDLFVDKKFPNEKQNSKNEMKPVCNYCGFLHKAFYNEDKRFFNACCSKKTVKTNNIERPMIIEFDASEAFEIERPNWCPVHGIGSETNLLPSKPTTEVKPLVKKFKDMTYMEKKDEFKKIPKRIKWEDIKVDEIYLIPRILSTPRKIIRVASKTNDCITYHEISEYSWSEYSYTTSMHPTDAEAAMIVKLHKF